jgi:hypothetical protein
MLRVDPTEARNSKDIIRRELRADPSLGVARQDRHRGGTRRFLSIPTMVTVTLRRSNHEAPCHRNYIHAPMQTILSAKYARGEENC